MTETTSKKAANLMAEKAYITGEVLKWARKTANISIEDAAKRVKVSPERLLAWENSSDYPTISQGKTLSKLYRRAFSIFFLPEAPLDFLPLQDFRRPGAKELDTASIFLIREIQEKQEWLRDYFEESGELELDFVGKFSLKDQPEIVANDMLSTLGILPGEYDKEPLQVWIEKAESVGIFISRTSYIHSKMIIDQEVLQGFAIADQYAPFIFVNSRDWKAAQLFTLVHELAHIWIAKSGISNEVEEGLAGKVRTKAHPVEVFCNRIAANALMPEQVMKNINQNLWQSETSIYKLAQQLGVSSLSLLIRAVHRQSINFSEYEVLKHKAEQAYHLFVQKERHKKLLQAAKKGGGPSVYRLRLNRNGKEFTKVVLDSYRSGAISPSVASGLLSTSSNKFVKFEKLLVNV